MPYRDLYTLLPLRLIFTSWYWQSILLHIHIYIPSYPRVVRSGCYLPLHNSLRGPLFHTEDRVSMLNRNVSEVLSVYIQLHPSCITAVITLNLTMFNEVRKMKTYGWVWAEVGTILTSALTAVKKPASRSTVDWNPRNPLGKRRSRPQIQSGGGGERNNLWSCWESNHGRSVHGQARIWETK